MIKRKQTLSGSDALMVWPLMLIYFTSGACSLMDEVVWIRLLKLTLGNTVYASSILVSVFMAGLAIGAWIMGRHSDKIKHPLRLYCLLELLITVSVVCSPYLLKLADTLYVSVYQGLSPSGGVLLLIQIVVSSLILLIPTILMGSTLPLLGKFVTSVESQTGRFVGRLYALNTLGAATGCFLAGFVLIRILGVMGTLYMSAALNLSIVCAVWLIYVRAGKRDTAMVGVPEEKAHRQTLKADSGIMLLAAGFFLSGVLSIAYEILWMRSVVFHIGSFTYVFSAILTIYLMGNVLGTWTGVSIVKRVKNPAAVYGLILAVLGVSGVLYIPWLGLNVLNIAPILEGALLSKTFLSYVFGPLLFCGILLLVPSFIMGLGFPFMLQAWVNRVHRIGQSTGAAYTANTSGAVVGGLLAGFVLIPLLGLQQSIMVCGFTGVIVGLFILLKFAQRRRMANYLTAAVCMVILVIVSLLIPGNSFNRIVAAKTAGSYELVAVKEGINTTVSLHREREGKTLYLFASGQRVAGNSPGFRGDQKILGHLGVLLNKQTGSALTVGFGTGESSLCLTNHGLSRVDCVEISPEVVEFSLKYFNDINLGHRLYDKVGMILMDARNYLHLTRQHYDVIINDCTSMRGFAENASLYTKEHFETARTQLNNGGLFMSWIDCYTTESAEVINSVIGTMKEVFPYVTLWYVTPEPAPFFVIVGSELPQKIPVAHIYRELTKPDVAASLAFINIHGVEDLLSCYIGDQDDLSRYLKTYKVNSDYTPFVEFYPNRVRAGRIHMREFLDTVRTRSVYEHIDWSGISESGRAGTLQKFGRLYKASYYILMAATSADYMEQFTYSTAGLKVIGENAALQRMKDTSEDRLFQLARMTIKNGNMGDAADLARAMLAEDSDCALAHIINSVVAIAAGDLERALISANLAVELEPQKPETWFNLSLCLEIADRLDEAEQANQKGMQLLED